MFPNPIFAAHPFLHSASCAKHTKTIRYSVCSNRPHLTLLAEMALSEPCEVEMQLYVCARKSSPRLWWASVMNERTVTLPSRTQDGFVGQILTRRIA